MDTNEPQIEQSGSGCDSSSGDSIPCAPGGKRNWRTILFVAVVLVAGAVAARSVLTNGGKGACGIGELCSIDEGSGQASSTIAACPLEQGNGNGNGNGNGEVCPQNAACPIGQECSQDCPCPSMGTCPSQQQTCPMSSGQGEAAGCCPATAPADPAPQPAPTGCCCSASGS